MSPDRERGYQGGRGVGASRSVAFPVPDGATIILTGSDVSIKGYPGRGVDSATKAAVRSFARTWTTDLYDQGRGIRVNLVSPGPVGTAMLVDHPEGMEVVASRVPM